MKTFLILCLCLLSLMIVYFALDNSAGFRNFLHDKFGLSVGQDKNVADDSVNAAISQRQMDMQRTHFKFAGEGYLPTYIGNNIDMENSSHLIKGKLRDPSYQEIYDKLPDTLELEFAASLYFVEKSAATAYEPEARFAFDGKWYVDTLKIDPQADDYLLRRMLDRLIYEGKAEGYRIYPEKFASSKYIYPYGVFENKYGSHFQYNDNLESLDYDVKEVLLEFFNSAEGDNFGYPEDRRIYRELIHIDNFTGSGKDEVALVLCDKEREKTGDSKEVLLIVAYDNAKQRYYTLYKSFVYGKIVIETIVYDTETHYYQGAHLEDSPNPPYYSVLMKVAGEPDRILHYDKEFDEMKTINTEDLENVND